MLQMNLGMEPHGQKLLIWQLQDRQDQLQVQLDRGEPEAMVIPGLKEAGHRVNVTDEQAAWVALVITCAG